VTKIRRQYGWLVLASYLSLAATVPMLTPVPQQDFALPPIMPLLVADNSESDAMMLPLRQQASAALHALQISVPR
jgi:hypothetical protein